jgi:hypothetical protein
VAGGTELDALDGRRRLSPTARQASDGGPAVATRRAR